MAIYFINVNDLLNQNQALSKTREARCSDCFSHGDKFLEEVAQGGKGLFCLTVWKDTVTHGGKGMTAVGSVVTGTALW